MDISYVIGITLFEAPDSLAHIIKIASSPNKAIHYTTVVYINGFWVSVLKKVGY